VLQIMYVAIAFLLLCLFLGIHVRPIWQNIRMMLPWATFFFVIHVFFFASVRPEMTFIAAARHEAIVLCRLAGLSGVMGSLRDGIDAQALVDSLKTLMDRIGLRSRLAEDALQTLRLILVFIPQVLQEYKSLEYFNRALGFATPSTLRLKVQFYGGNLLPVLSRSLERARRLGEGMRLRGYGQVIPRGQLTPLPFGVWDAMLVLFIAVLLGSAWWVS
jgi:energy-coupling factor transporter transmembrane protein EcfT